MITSLVLKEYFDDSVLNIHNQGFPITSEVLYSPGLHFDPELRKYMISNDIEFKELEATDNWMGMIWNKETLKRSEDIPRRLAGYTENQMTSTGVRYDARMGELTVHIAFVSTSISDSETLEEFLIAGNMRDSYTVDIGGTIGNIKVSVKSFDVASMTKEETVRYGSLLTLYCDAVLVYPVIVQGPDVKLISEINFDLYNWYGVKFSDMG